MRKDSFLNNSVMAGKFGIFQYFDGPLSKHWQPESPDDLLWAKAIP